MESFSFNSLINLAEEGKWLLGVTSFELTNSVFNIISKNKKFSNFNTRCLVCQRRCGNKYWTTRFFRSWRTRWYWIICVRSSEKRNNKIKRGDKEYKLPDPDTRKNEINEELKNREYNNLADMVFRSEVTYSEIENIVDIEYIATSAMR